MYTNCDEIFKITIPAVRIAVAKSLDKKHHMSQAEIAKSLGTTQAAVSKYLSNKYSTKISKIEKLVESKGLAKHIVEGASKHSKKVSDNIDQLASSATLVKETMKIL